MQNSIMSPRIRLKFIIAERINYHLYINIDSILINIKLKALYD